MALNNFNFSRIKDVYFPIFNYTFHHRPTSEFVEDKNHLKRSKIFDSIYDLLDTPVFCGVYLIAGLRGSGKTSLIKSAIRKYRRKTWLTRNVIFERYQVIDVNFSGANLTSFEILKAIAWSMHDMYKKRRAFKFLKFVYYLIFTAVIWWLSTTNFVRESLQNPFVEFIGTIFGSQKTELYKLIFWVGFIFIADRILPGLLIFFFKLDVAHSKNIRRLDVLNQRISSNDVEREAILKYAEAKVSGSEKKKFKDLTEREIAYELEQIIFAASSNWLMKSHFIFVVDELDKITAPESDGSTSDLLQKRRDKIFLLLGELKQFFTKANAKFFFVTGSEMYDASLADVVERDSYLGSIFHRVVYIPSFFSDFNNHSSDITNQTERYVCQFLAPQKCSSLAEFYGNFLDRAELTSQQKIKFHYLLGSFILYLVFRSKGSPKRIVSLFEENLVKVSDFEREINGDDYGLYVYGFTKNYLNYSRAGYAKTNSNTYQKLKKSVATRLKMLTKHKSRYDFDPDIKYVLVFDEFDQYKLGLTSYLYSPFLYSYSFFITNHSDKLIMSSAFLWDHIFKYHSTAFSAYHLEYIYELLSSTKAPEVKKQLTYLLFLMKGRFIREIRSGLFDYKFNSRLRSELRFLSSVIQTEAAVFNFMLDESSALKRYFSSQYTAARKKLQDADEKNSFLTGFLARVIGDLYFYYQEYDQAIIYYEEALNPFNKEKFENFSNGELLNMCRWLLLLSLTYEKSGYLSKAFAICVDIPSDLKVIFKRNTQWKYEEILEFSKIFHEHLLQKMMLVEKNETLGVTRSYLDHLYTEKKNMYRDWNVTHEPIMTAEVDQKMFNILFLRNSDTDPQFRDFIKFGNNTLRTIGWKYFASACSLLQLDTSDLYTTLQRLETETADGLKSSVLVLVADQLSKAGNAFVAARNEESTIEKSTAEFFKFISSKSIARNFVENNHLILAYKLYSISAQLSKRVGMFGNACEQVLKRLYLLRELSRFSKHQHASSAIQIAEGLIDEALLYAHTNDEHNSRIYLKKIKTALRGGNLIEYENQIRLESSDGDVQTILESLPNSPDIREATLILYEILVRYDAPGYRAALTNMADHINGDSIVQNQYVRVMELNLKAEINFMNFKTLLGLKKSPNIGEELRRQIQNVFSDRVKFLEAYRLCVDSIYCFVEILRIINVQRNDFMIGYSVSGSMYNRLGWWATVRKFMMTQVTKLRGRKALESFKEIDQDFFNDFNGVEILLKRMIHQQSHDMSLSAKYNFERALDHFRRAVQSHNRGNEYKEFIHHLSVLEDDINDEFTHFMIARERLFINSGKLAEALKGTSKDLKALIQLEGEKIFHNHLYHVPVSRNDSNT